MITPAANGKNEDLKVTLIDFNVSRRFRQKKVIHPDLDKSGEENNNRLNDSSKNQ